MRLTCVALAIGLVSAAPASSAAPHTLQLENLRLNSEGKIQADVVVKEAPPPERGEAAVRFVCGNIDQVIRLIGLAAVGTRRAATMTAPLACDRSYRVTAMITAPENLKGHSIGATLARSCADADGPAPREQTASRSTLLNVSDDNRQSAPGRSGASDAMSSVAAGRHP